MAKLLLRADIVFHWGFWARAMTMSARQPTMAMPPPTTLMGALARGALNVLRPMGKAPTTEIDDPGKYRATLVADLARCVTAIGVRVVNGATRVNMDKTRLLQAPYIRQENLADPNQWRGIRDVGKAYSPATQAEATWVIDADCAEKLGLSKHLLTASALSITRIGPVEALVTPIRAETIPVENCEKPTREELRTPCPYFPAPHNGKTPPMGWVITEFLDWRDEKTWTRDRIGAGKVRYVVPIGEWATAIAEYPWCIELRNYVDMAKCGGRTYPETLLK